MRIRHNDISKVEFGFGGKGLSRSPDFCLVNLRYPVYNAAPLPADGAVFQEIE
jgi:hypothetical protein